MKQTYTKWRSALLMVVSAVCICTAPLVSAEHINMTSLTTINSSDTQSSAVSITSERDSQPVAPEKATVNESTANYDGHLDNFPSRKVTIVVPTKLRNNSTAQFGRYLTDRLSNTLKYPYYDTAIVSTNTPTTQIKAVDLAQIAAAQNSEIVIMPVPVQDVYVQLNSVTSPYSDAHDDGEIYIAAKVSALLYYYDVQDQTVHTVRSGFSQTDDSLTMPTHKSVWNKVVSVLLDKLPYKRIPTDRDRYQAPGINSESPVILDFQVEQPKNTAYSLKGVSVL